MTYKYIFLTLFLSIALLSHSQNKNETWDNRVADIKNKISKSSEKDKTPFYSKILKRGMEPEKVSLKISGWKQIVLYTYGTVDGNNYDHGAWGDAKLIKKNGEIFWLKDLKPIHYKTPYITRVLNTNFGNKTIQINSKSYPNGIMLHANGVIIFDLPEDFEKFEAEVGIDNGASNQASVRFFVHNQDMRKHANQLRKDFREESNFIENLLKIPLELWLTTNDDIAEKDLFDSFGNKFNNKNYLNSKIEEIEKSKVQNKSSLYLDLIKKICSLLDIEKQIKWINPNSLELAVEDMSKMQGFDKELYTRKLNELKKLYEDKENLLSQVSDEAFDKLTTLINLNREILLANPLLDFDNIVVTRFNLGSGARDAMGHSLGMPANNWSSMYSARRTGVDAEISILSNLRGDIQTKTIYKPEKKVNIADLQMHWDGDKLLFSSIDDKNKWQVYEIDINGNNFQKKIINDEPDLEFCDANYLPDGRIIACSNIGYHGVPCVNGDDAVGNLTIFNPANNTIRRLTFDQDGNWNPVVMNNGRVMYTRWEYTDLTHYFSRIVMHMNPDGTENKALYGSGSYWPNSTFDIKPLPGSTTRFIGVISGHHGIVRSGRLMIFDPSLSRKEEKGVIQEVPFRNRKVVPEIKDELVNGVWPQFLRPYPLNDNYFLVSAKLHPEGLWGIYLVDVFDNLTCITEIEGEGLNTPLAVRKTKTPPVIPDKVNLADKEATVFIQDIYEGEGTQGVPRGTIKELRIFSYEYAYLKSPSDHDAQGIQSGWDIKRLLGTVPVEEDGSAVFKVPANTPISIQPLDEKGRAIQLFRSWFTPMPGETVSCIGCHEDQNQIPIPKRVIASQRSPHKLKTPEGGVRSFTFDLEIQPILDRACIACHNGNDANPDLTSGRYDTLRRGTNIVRPLSKSYLAIMPYIYRQGPEAEMYVLKPYEYHASVSELVRLLEKGHYGVNLTDDEWKTLYNWIDFNAPHSGSFEQLTKINGYDQYERRMELMEKYNDIKVDWRDELRNYAEYLKGKGEIKPEMPKYKEKQYKTPTSKNWPLSRDKAVELKNKDNKADKTIQLAPGVSIKLVWIPAGEFVMGNNYSEPDCAPAFKTKVDKGFWMAECEVTNEQFKVFFPEHDSRFIGQFWKDHTTPGYAANKPNQPVIRISYEEAVEFCDHLGKLTGMKVKLPTETQWEWACRAGSGDEFWYGDLNSDFSSFENLADFQLTNMAVSGVDPQPMGANNPLRKYWDYVPKINTVNDGQMISGEVGKYKANPWGLKDMHGNVAEWTSSDYVNYPLKGNAKSEKKVVRGGSWYDRPKYAASHSRKAYYPWQKGYNVGFRIIIEE